MSTEINLNWWQRQHPALKVLIVVGSLGLVTWGGYAIFSPKKDDKKLPDGTTPPANQPASETTNTATHVETAPATHSAVVPPEGKTCGPVHEDFDEDFNYCKCEDGWYTISKARPKDAQFANKYPTWVDIKTHATSPDIAIQRLDARYTS